MSCPRLLSQYKTAKMPNIAAIDDFPEPEYLEGATPTPHERMLALVAHLGGLLLSFVPPAILMVTQRGKSAFVVRHAREAVNFHITLWFHALLVFLPATGVGAALYLTGTRAPIAFLFGSLVALVLSIPMVIFEVLYIVRACLAAGKGQEFRYPLTIRLI